MRTHEIVDTMDRLDLLELIGESPWPDLADGDEAFPIAWEQVERDIEVDSARTPLDEQGEQWARVEESLRTRVRGGGGTPPPVIVDSLAWYQPIHYFGLAWGIYIREEAVFELAAYLLEAVIPERRFERDVVFGALRVGLAVLYLHETFHHRIESFAIGLEIVERARRYCPYHDKVFKPLRAAGSSDLLEEALATAESFRRRHEAVYKRAVPEEVRRAARVQLVTWIRSLPPGYNRAEWYFAGGPFDSAIHELCSQVHEGVSSPARANEEWRLASNMHRTMFNCKTVTWIVVPLGSRPLVPWFDQEATAELSISSRALTKALRKTYGYQESPGSKHMKLVGEGRPTLVLPTNRESLSPGVLTNTAHALGFPSARVMWDALSASR